MTFVNYEVPLRFRNYSRRRIRLRANWIALPSMSVLLKRYTMQAKRGTGSEGSCGPQSTLVEVRIYADLLVDAWPPMNDRG